MTAETVCRAGGAAVRLSHSQVLEAALDDVWANFMDLETVGR